MAKRKADPPTSDATHNATQAPPGSATATKKAKGANAKPEIPTLPWAANNSEKVWLFIVEMGKLENFKVLLGKKDKSDVSDAHLEFFRIFPHSSIS